MTVQPHWRICWILSLSATICIFYGLGSLGRPSGGSPPAVRGTQWRSSSNAPDHRKCIYGPEDAAAHRRGDDSRNVLDIFNETLGFEQIRMISMRERTDKRDAFAVLSDISGLQYQVADGVDGSKVYSKALPHKMQQSDKAVGCWRAHLNVWQEILQKRIATTLVFEDDVDWDVGLRAQMLELAKAARYIHAEDGNTQSPYGDEWDLLWIGHCGSGPAPWNNRRWVIRNDPTVLPAQARDHVGQPAMSRWEEGPDGDDSTRIIFPAIGGVCTGSYAISLRGARKALYKMSMLPFNNPVDWGLNDLCADRDFGFKCIAPFPQIIGLYRPAGNRSSWSDIGYGPDAEQLVDEDGHPERLVFSTRHNLDRLLQHKRPLFRSVHPEATGPELGIKDITRGVGHPETVPIPSEYLKMSNDELRQIRWAWAPGLE